MHLKGCRLGLIEKNNGWLIPIIRYEYLTLISINLGLELVLPPYAVTQTRNK